MADGLVVHDVAGLRLVLRAHDGHVERPQLLVRLLGVLANGLDQRTAADGLVRHHQDAERLLAHSRLPAGAGSSAWGVLNTPCTAPGTPYSYGPPTTVGTSSKLKTGGGDETCHSSVSARHGFAGARGPPRHDATML